MVTSEDVQPAAALAAAPQPPARPMERGFVPVFKALARYLGQTEVHTYAFSVAANAILSLFPFIVMLYTIARRVFHSPAMVAEIGSMLHDLLPSNQDFVVRNMSLLVNPRGSVQLASVVMLLISSSGVFLPLEVALNQVWGVTRNRSYLMNQLVSLGLAFAVGLLALFAVTVATAQTGILTFLFFHHTENLVYGFIHHIFIEIAVAFLSVGMFFVVYWILPNREAAGAGRAAHGDRDRADVGRGAPSLHSGAAAPRSAFSLWAVRGLGRADDLGLSDRAAAACRSPVFGDAAHSAAGAPGGSGSRARS